MENYIEYLKSDHWKERRKAFKSKSCGRCFICEKKSGSMDVHHKTYSRNGKSILFDERDDELCLLCHDCHFRMHKYSLDGYLRSNLPDAEKKKVIQDTFKRVEDKKSRTIYIPSYHYTKPKKKKGPSRTPSKKNKPVSRGFSPELLQYLKENGFVSLSKK